MATTELITINGAKDAIAELTNPVLKKSADSLIKAADPLAKSIRYKESGLYQAAVALGYVKIELDRISKLGKSADRSNDGFTNVRDYAEKLFGINRSQAYMLATTGERFYIPALSPKEIPQDLAPEVREKREAVETAYNEFLSKVPASNLSELVSIDPEEVKTAVTNGEITATTTQAEMRKWRQAAKPETAKVLPQYNGYVDIHGANLQVDRMTIDEIGELIKSRYESDITLQEVTVKPLPTDRDGIKRVIFYSDTHVFMAVLEKAPAKAKAKKSKVANTPSNPFAGMSREEAMAMFNAAFDTTD